MSKHPFPKELEVIIRRLINQYLFLSIVKEALDAIRKFCTQ